MCKYCDKENNLTIECINKIIEESFKQCNEHRKTLGLSLSTSDFCNKNEGWQECKKECPHNKYIEELIAEPNYDKFLNRTVEKQDIDIDFKS